jgi:acetoin utilization protein AcuB
MQYVFDLPDAPGSVTSVIETLREFQTRVISVLTSFEDAAEGEKRVSIRVTTEDENLTDELTKTLKKKFTVVYHGKDELKDLPHK